MHNQYFYVSFRVKNPKTKFFFWSLNWWLVFYRQNRLYSTYMNHVPYCSKVLFDDSIFSKILWVYLPYIAIRIIFFHYEDIYFYYMWYCIEIVFIFSAQIKSFLEIYSLCLQLTPPKWKGRDYISFFWILISSNSTIISILELEKYTYRNICHLFLIFCNKH